MSEGTVDLHRFGFSFNLCHENGYELTSVVVIAESVLTRQLSRFT